MGRLKNLPMIKKNKNKKEREAEMSLTLTIYSKTEMTLTNSLTGEIYAHTAEAVNAVLHVLNDAEVRYFLNIEN